jgi:hypothetical protein
MGEARSATLFQSTKVVLPKKAENSISQAEVAMFT